VTKIRCGVIGAGHLGKIHARIMRTLPEFELVSIIEPIEAARAAAAETFQCAVDSDHRPWVERLDAVIVATPTKLHHRIAADFLRAGKHVFVEKPLTSDVDEAAELVTAARRTRTVLQVGHVERFNPAWSSAVSRLSAPNFVECRREGPFTFRSTDISVVLDLMIHDIDLTASLVRSPVIDVEAFGDRWFGKQHDEAYARLKFENGCVAVLHASRVATSAARRMRLRTDRELAQIDFQTRTVDITHLDARLQRGEIDVEQMTAAERDAAKKNLGELLRHETAVVDPYDAITAEQIDFAESILTGRRPRVSGDDGLEAVRIAHRIVEAVERQASEATDDRAAIVRGPHWNRTVRETQRRREAG